MPDIAVGDTVTTAEQLAALPVETVIRSEGGLIAERGEPPVSRGPLGGFHWEVLGGLRSKTHLGASFHSPWTVLWLPPAPVTEVTFDATVMSEFGNGGFFSLAGADRLALKPLVGSDVTVTVRRKDTDDE